MRKPYFSRHETDPDPIRHTVERRVRFEEADPLGVVWHGCYASYFEDARMALTEQLGIGYLELMARKVAAPIRRMNIDYVRPLRFPEYFTIEGALHYTPAARINIEFTIRNSQGQVTTTGCTVQMLTTPGGDLLMAPPDFLEDFNRRWLKGEIG